MTQTAPTITPQSYSAGQTLRCTITRVPKAEGGEQTLLRLMRRDPAIAKSLRRAQMLRRRRMVSYIRGGREWYARERVGTIAQVELGNTWTFRFTPDVAADMASVADCFSIEAVK